jgi:hypothetical protein
LIVGSDHDGDYEKSPVLERKNEKTKDRLASNVRASTDQVCRIDHTPRSFLFSGESLATSDIAVFDYEIKALLAYDDLSSECGEIDHSESMISSELLLDAMESNPTTATSSINNSIAFDDRYFSRNQHRLETRTIAHG